MRYDRLIRVRSVLREDIHAGRSGRLQCPLCNDPLHFSATTDKRFFLAHPRRDPNDVSEPCPYRANGPSPQDILARKYHGLRESFAHKRLKGWIAHSASADPRFSGVVEEEVWKGSRGWRKPDVSAVLATDINLKLAFEAQLSTTFISVVVERRLFYREEGALLVWFLGYFDPQDRRMTIDDILFTNNSNVMVVNERTRALSLECKRFMMQVHWREPRISTDAVYWDWKSRIAAFDEMTIDLEGQRCFLVDCAALEVAIYKELEEGKRERELQRLVDDFVAILQSTIKFWGAKPDKDDGIDTNSPWFDWFAFEYNCSHLDLNLPTNPWDERLFLIIGKAIASARAGRPIGWSYAKLVQVGHYLFDNAPSALWHFGRALDAYHTRRLIEQEDHTGKWKERCEVIRERMKAREAEVMADHSWDGVFRVFFPDVFRR